MKLICYKGPCLLFSRIKKGVPIKYYACSAYRDRKQCSFYWPADRRFPLEKARQTLRLAREILSKIRKLNSKNRSFCFDCSRLLPDDEDNDHDNHQLRKRITNRQLDRPSFWLPPVGDRRGEAQYWFTQETAHFLVKTVKRLPVDGVACIGVPRLYELLHSSSDKRSFLLDIDDRYVIRKLPSDFARFNLFVSYFFTKEGKAHFKQFLESCQHLLVVVDPPFGGLAKHVGKMLRTIERMHSVVHQSADIACDFLWIFPYFLERRVIAAMPQLRMLDYQVRLQLDKSSRKRVSPARIFTSIDPASIPLPVHEGKYKYVASGKFCNICKMFVAAENRHCQICGTCTSKNGRPYVHCFPCGKCVKATNVHCETCSICHRKGNCTAEENTQASE
ncbi:N6-adenineMlase domain containing protein [Trichuris trichiura]|uniref:N6-adenineMlase domain containing protein n=1 Tax=Trichuris trichiura TaxID=36087 RepID=A0A077Z0H0_TRITR|nr:N6-adenineMlase domain containing protein [Trichuris trichiura]